MSQWAMKVPGAVLRVVALAILLSLPAVAAHAYGDLVIYSDDALTDTTLNDNAPRIVKLHVVHKNHIGSVGVRFAVTASPGFTGVWLADESPYVEIGNSPTDISIGYGTCAPAGLKILTMTYELFGTSGPCSSLKVVPAAGFLSAICLECFYEYPCCKLGTLHVNCAVATEPTTWGKVKALYR